MPPHEIFENEKNRKKNQKEGTLSLGTRLGLLHMPATWLIILDLVLTLPLPLLIFVLLLLLAAGQQKQPVGAFGANMQRHRCGHHKSQTAGGKH